MVTLKIFLPFNLLRQQHVCVPRRRKFGSEIPNLFPKTHPIPLLIQKNLQPQQKNYALESMAKNGMEFKICRFQLEAIEFGVRVFKLIPEKLLRKNAGIAFEVVRL